MSYNQLDVNILQANNNKTGEHVQKVSRTECWWLWFVEHSLILRPRSERHPLLGNEPQGTATPLLLFILPIFTVISVLHTTQLWKGKNTQLLAKFPPLVLLFVSQDSFGCKWQDRNTTQTALSSKELFAAHNWKTLWLHGSWIQMLKWCQWEQSLLPLYGLGLLRNFVCFGFALMQPLIALSTW